MAFSLGTTGRHGKRPIPGRRLIPAALFAVIMAVIAVPFAPPSQVEGGQILWLLVMAFAVLTPATALTTYGPRFLPAPEASLLTLGETVLGPLWVLAVIGEAPTTLGFLGGAIVLTALVANALLGLYRYRKAVPTGGRDS